MRPAGQSKIDDQVLYHLLAEKQYNQHQAANHFGVTEAAISKRVKALQLNLSRHVGLERASDVAQHGLDVVNQLQRINRVISEELDWSLPRACSPRVRLDPATPTPPGPNQGLPRGEAD
jgi:predicted transcriptional regulator